MPARRGVAAAQQAPGRASVGASGEKNACIAGDARAARRAAIDQVLERIHSDNRYHGVHADHDASLQKLEAEILAVSVCSRGCSTRAAQRFVCAWRTCPALRRSCAPDLHRVPARGCFPEQDLLVVDSEQSTAGFKTKTTVRVG